MNRRSCLVVAGIVLASLVFSLPARAIIGGTLDKNDHPYVAMVVVYDEEGNYLWRGSGTLIGPRLLLTAGHITFAPAVRAQVFFDSRIPDDVNFRVPDSGGVMGTPVTHPLYDDFASFPVTYDVGVVHLDEDVVLDRYGVLPDVGALDALAKTRKTRQQFDVVGYGLQYLRWSPIKGDIHVLEDFARYKGLVTLIGLGNNLSADGVNLQHTGDSGKGNVSGGTHLGDSGGPVLLAGTDVVVGITSFGANDSQGTGPGYAYRTDTLDTQLFIYDQLLLAEELAGLEE